MSARYFDAHCHIQFDGYDEDREALITHMSEEGVHGLVVGVDQLSSEGAISLAQHHDHLYASVGLHPNDVDVEVFDREVFSRLAADGKVVAIGECGLDYFRPEEPDAAKQKQREVFQAHIDLAIETRKPLMIHARPSKGTMDAYEDALAMVEDAKHDHPELRGNFHFFVGDVSIANRIIALDFTVSFTAVLTFTHDYDEVVRAVPLTHILSETDSPFVAPASRRGKRNDPTAVREVVAALARIRGENEEVVQKALLDNARRLFSL